MLGDCHELCFFLVLLFQYRVLLRLSSSSFFYPLFSIFPCLFLLRHLCLCFRRVSHSFPSPCSCFTNFSFLPLPSLAFIQPLPPPPLLILFFLPPPSSSCFYSYISVALPSFFCFSSPLLFLFFIQPFTRLRRVGPGYNDIGVCDTPSITLYILRYQ